MEVSYITSHKGDLVDLRRCVQSVYLDLKGSGFSRYEHLIYLDGIDENDDYSFLHQFPHIKVYHSKNSLGKATRVNELLRNALGELIYFIDSDDLTLRGRTDEQARRLKDSCSLISGTNFYYWQEGYTFTYSNYPCDNNNIKKRFWQYPYLLYSSIAIKRSDCAKHKISLNEDLKGGIDFELYSRLFKCMKVENIKEPLVAYKVNTKGGITNSKKTREEQLNVHKQIMAKLLGLNYSKDGDLIDILFQYCVLGSQEVPTVHEKNLLSKFLTNISIGRHYVDYFEDYMLKDESTEYISNVIKSIEVR